MAIDPVPNYQRGTSIKAEDLNRFKQGLKRLENIKGVGGCQITYTSSGILIDAGTDSTPSVYFVIFKHDPSGTNPNTYLNSYPSAPTSAVNNTRVFPAQIQSVSFTDNVAGGGGSYGTGTDKSLPILGTVGDYVPVFNTALVHGLSHPTYIPEGVAAWVYYVDDQYYIDYEFPKIVFGKLTSSMPQGGSASMTVYYINASVAAVASPYSLPNIYDIGLMTGGTLASGSFVYAHWIENQFSATVGTSPGYWIIGEAKPC